jgi:AcrR family transcriptional regulator
VSVRDQLDAAPASVRRTQAERRAETEQRVLAATMTIIAEHGVQAVTAASVGETAGYSRGIVNHQFGTRLALLKTVAETAQSRFDPNPDALEGRAHLVSLVARYFSSVDSAPQDACVFLRLMTAALSGEEPALQDVFVQRDKHFRQHVVEALEHGQRDRSIRSDLDPSLTAALIVGLLRGTALQLQLAPETAALKALPGEAARLVENALTPARPGPGARRSN